MYLWWRIKWPLLRRGYVLEKQEVNVSLGRIPTGPSLRGIKMQTILEIKYESTKDGNQAEEPR